jgi:hypothetical protein
MPPNGSCVGIAKTVVGVCDHSSHQYNLRKPAHFTKTKLMNDIANILKLITRVRHQLEIPKASAAGLEEDALLELKHLVPIYYLWRQRCHETARSSTLNSLAKKTAVGLRDALDKDGRLPAINEDDNSHDALVCLLDALGKGAVRAAQEAAVKHRNPFGMLICDDYESSQEDDDEAA